MPGFVLPDTVSTQSLHEKWIFPQKDLDIPYI